MFFFYFRVEIKDYGNSHILRIHIHNQDHVSKHSGRHLYQYIQHDFLFKFDF